MMYKWMLSFMMLLLFLSIEALPQTGSVVLKDTTGTTLSTYNSISAAYSAVVAPLTQAYIIEILTPYDASNETFPIVLSLKPGSSASNYITIRPAEGNTGEVIAATVNTPIITLDDADFVTIDGRPGGTGNIADLTIKNNSTASGGFTFRFLNGACNNTLRYINIINGTANVAGPRTIEFGTSATNISGNSNNLVSYCKITGGRSGVGFSGTAANPNSDNTIRFCEISNFGYAAIWMLSSTQATTVENCTIFQTSSSTSSLMYGFNIAASAAGRGTVIRKNKIFNIQSTSTSTSLAIRGIYASLPNNATITIENNFISLPLDNQNATVIGIHLFGSGDYGANVLYNSIRIAGSHGSGVLAGVASAGIYKVNTGDTSSYVQKNNICINERSGGSGIHTGSYIDTSFSMVDADYNTYFSTGTGSSHAGWSTLFFTDLAAYQAAAFPNELHSKFYTAVFASGTDLHLSGTSLGDNNLAGTPIADVTTDIDNDARGLLTPYMGADEGAIPLSSGPSIIVISPNGGEGWLIGAVKNITWNNTAGITNVSIKYTTDNGTNWMPVATNTPAAGGTYAWTVPNTPGTQCKVRIADALIDTIFDISNAVFTISAQQIISIPMNMATGWNMTSVPVVAADMTASALYPGMNSSVFSYNNGYVTQTVLTNGAGYWVRYAAAASFSISGTAVSGTTIPLAAGWNMIGIFNTNIPVADLTTTPSGIVNSLYFGFENGYTQAATLNTGKGYWVRTTAAGTLNLPALNKKTGIQTTGISPNKNWGKVIVSDADGKSAVLYVADAGANTAVFDLPPTPPAGVFDVRYFSNAMAECIGSTPKAFSINGAKYPVSIRLEGASIIIQDKATGGKELYKTMRNGQSVVLQNPGIQTLELLSIDKPTEYELSQNYPNPFNPATTIRYGLPEKSLVSLVIYNQLGQLVQTLFAGEKDAGFYSAEWNAGNMPSGVYFCEMKTQNFTSVRKLLLMK